MSGRKAWWFAVCACGLLFGAACIVVGARVYLASSGGTSIVSKASAHAPLTLIKSEYFRRWDEVRKIRERITNEALDDRREEDEENREWLEWERQEKLKALARKVWG